LRREKRSKGGFQRRIFRLRNLINKDIFIHGSWLREEVKTEGSWENDEIYGIIQQPNVTSVQNIGAINLLKNQTAERGQPKVLGRKYKGIPAKRVSAEIETEGRRNPLPKAAFWVPLARRVQALAIRVLLREKKEKEEPGISPFGPSLNRTVERRL